MQSSKNKPKKVLIISSKEIEKNNFRCFKSLYQNDQKPLIFYSSVDPFSIHSYENTSFFKTRLLKEYLIFEAKNMNFYIWINPDDEEIIQNSIIFLQNCFNHENNHNFDGNNQEDNDAFSNDIILFLYFLFDERVLQNNFSYYYKIIIHALVEIFINTIPQKSIKSNFSFNGVWDQFFNWLHEIEPSVLYSFFLRQRVGSILLDNFQNDSELKMPAIYFTPYFLKKLPDLEFPILKKYCLQMSDIKLDTPEIYLISIFPFYSKSSDNIKINTRDSNKINLVNRIIKGRINQSSHVSELTIACFREQIKKLNINEILKLKNIPDLINQNRQNSLAIERNQPQNEHPYFQVIPEQDEPFVYYGLPCQIRLQTSQDYYNCYEKKFFINYPLQLIEDPLSSFQNRKISKYFRLSEKSEDKFKFLINNTQTYDTFMNLKGSLLFKNLLQKYTNDKVPFHFQRMNDTDKAQIIDAFQSIFNMKKCIEIYKRPLTIKKCSEELEKYLNKVKPKSKSTPASEQEPKPASKQIKSTKTKNGKTSKGTSHQNKKRIDEKPKSTNNEIPYFFIKMTDSPYFIIDSVSNFISAKFDDYLQSFPIQKQTSDTNQTEYSLEFFDIKYIKNELYNDMLIIDDNDGTKNNAPNIHLENIIKISLFSALYDKFHTVFINYLPKFRLLPPQHFLFLFIFYKAEEKNSTIRKSTINDKMKKAFVHIQQMTEIKVERLSKLYICYNKKDRIKELNIKSQFFYPPPFMFTILDQFYDKFGEKISYIST